MTLRQTALLTAVAAVTLAVSACTPRTRPPARPVSPVGLEVKACQQRIDEYVALHRRVEAGIPSLRPDSDPAEITAREQALGQALIAARPDARPGDVLAPECQEYFGRAIEEDFAARPAADRKALIVELPRNVRVTVNSVYPPEVPLATVPSNLLQKLPTLPEQLEYRIVGRHLILRDVKGNVVVDMLPDVIPIPQ